MKDQINKAWSWLKVEATEIVQSNKFGNVIFRDIHGQFWRICPEELLCEIIADSVEKYNLLIKDEDFLMDWFMEALVEKAEDKFGPQPNERCFCLKMPVVLGGAYDIDNIGTVPRLELITFSGDIAGKIKDLPDGSKVEFKFVD